MYTGQTACIAGFLATSLPSTPCCNSASCIKPYRMHNTFSQQQQFACARQDAGEADPNFAHNALLCTLKYRHTKTVDD